ncbi:N-formyl peptide receptor 2-like [Leptodactylus fuscus]
MDPDDYNLTFPNTSLNYDYLSVHYYNGILQKISITLFSLIFVLGIIGNGLVIWIAGFRMKKTISAVWFRHLAIADFLCCASLPLRIAYNFYFFSKLYINPICVLGVILFCLNTSASVLLLTAMSIDRCVSVLWPFWAKAHRTRGLVRITAGAIWGFSFLLTAFMFYLHGFCKTDLYYDDFMYLQKIEETILPIRLVIMFVIPFLIILTSYVIIFQKIRSSKRPQRSQRPYRIITAVILCFFICWSPFYTWPLISVYISGYIQYNIIFAIIIILAYLNSCLNPIIYVFMGQDFRQGFLRSIPTRVKGALSDHPDDLCGERDGL